MGSKREHLLLACLLVAESAWIGVLAALVGDLMGNPGGVLTWPGVLATLGAGAGASRMLARGEQQGRRMLAGALLGAATVYLVTAWHHGSLAWPWLLRGTGGALEATRTGFTLVGAILLWWRGAALATLSGAWETLASGFRIGLVVLAVGAMAEALGKRPVGAAWATPPFVVASLTGLAISHLTEEHWARWGRALAALVGGILVAGIVAAVGVATPLSLAAQWLVGGLGTLARWLILALVIPLAYIVEFLVKVIVGLLRWLLGGAQPVPPQPPALDFLENLKRQASEGGGITPAVVGGVKWGLLALACAGALYLLGRVLWARRLPLTLQPEGEHEAIADEEAEDALAFLRAHLSFRGRPRKEAEAPPLLALPEGATPGERVVRAYFRLLNAATMSGILRPPWRTPWEFAPDLEKRFPGLPIRPLTDAFVRLRWGGHTPDTQEALALERAIAQGLDVRAEGESGAGAN